METCSAILHYVSYEMVLDRKDIIHYSFYAGQCLWSEFWITLRVTSRKQLQTQCECHPMMINYDSVNLTTLSPPLKFQKPIPSLTSLISSK